MSQIDPRTTTTRGGDPVQVRLEQEAEGNVGQHRDYVVLTAEERGKGFVRPVRRSYTHVGIPGPTYPLRDLDDEERERTDGEGYIKFEAYPPGGRSSAVGRFWTQADLDRVGKGCGAVTSMGVAIAETYARQPGFYGFTFCVACNAHLPVGADGEFTWPDGTRVGT